MLGEPVEDFGEVVAGEGPVEGFGHGGASGRRLRS